MPGRVRRFRQSHPTGPCSPCHVHHKSVGGRLLKTRPWPATRKALQSTSPTRAPHQPGRTLSPADGHLAGWLRQEQAQLMCLSRHAPTASRHSPASKPRVCLLGRHLVERRPLATRWPPPTSRRSCGSAAGAAGAVEVALPPTATACDWDLSSLMWALASHWQGHYGCVCVRVGAMPIERKTHP